MGFGRSGDFGLGAEDLGVASWHASLTMPVIDIGSRVQSFITLEKLWIVQTFIMFRGI